MVWEAMPLQVLSLVKNNRKNQSMEKITYGTSPVKIFQNQSKNYGVLAGALLERSKLQGNANALMEKKNIL